MNRKLYVALINAIANVVDEEGPWQDKKSTIIGLAKELEETISLNELVSWFNGEEVE